jgi:hypothetical protein
MAYFGHTYLTDIKPVLSDWLTNTGVSKNVTDLPLSLANRAQDNLWAKKPWSNLAVRVSISLTVGVYTLPAAFGRIIDMWADLGGNGLPSYWYYEGDNYSTGYRLDAGFAMATGYNRTITFNYAQSSSAWLRYQKLLSNFTGVAGTTEYSFFPAELIILEAQKINSLGKGNIKEYQGYAAMFEEVFKDFCNASQWINYDPNPKLNDRLGNEVFVESYSLNGEGLRNNRTNPDLPNSFIL